MIYILFKAGTGEGCKCYKPGPRCFRLRGARNCSVVVKVTRAKCLDTDWPLVHPSFSRRGLGWRYRIRVTIESVVNVQATVILYGHDQLLLRID